MKAKFLIDTPPPTISGNLHIGHIFSYTQADIIAKYHKYKGEELLYPWCFDNNGIPTAKLANNKKIRGKENILDFSIKRSEQYLKTFNDCGIYFSEHNYHTFDDRSIQIAYMAFERLKKKGIAYKKETEFMWCPKQKCSISQSELNDKGIIERSGEKPIIKKGEGWFINIMDHIPQIREKIEQINWRPIGFKKRIHNWCDKLEWDWSISRERHYGIPIPGEEFETFDTWFISSLTPQLAWSSYTGEPSLDCPIFDMRYQSHDIIRTWAFYTIAMSYFLNNQIPWENLMITGHTLDGNGDKFSKSSGNATSAQPLLNKHKISGIRHWASSSTLGNDICIDEEKMKMGWRIQNKLNNARKFIEMQKKNEWIGEDTSLINEWDKYKLEICDHFELYEIDKAQDKMYKFFWNKFCDKWIERSKKKSISSTLSIILDDFEKLFKIIY